MASFAFIHNLRNVVVLFVHVITNFQATTTVVGLIDIPSNYTVTAIYVFGDSIVDTGNNNNLFTTAKCNYPPYGRDFPGGIPTGRFSNGKVPSDLIAEELGIKDLVPAYADPNLQPQDLVTGICFASGGAGFDPLTSKLASAISLSDQLGKFEEYRMKLDGIVGEEKAKLIIKNSINVVVAGSNDIANTYFLSGVRKNDYDINSYTDLMVDSANIFFKELYGLGARRIGIFSLPAIGCVPSQRTIGGGFQRDCVNEYNEASVLFNHKLKISLENLQTQLPQIKLVLIDIYNPLIDLIFNPAKYGFEVSDRGCCGTGKIEVTFLCNKYVKTCSDETKYVFWDSFHPTEAAYRTLLPPIIKKYVNSFF